MNQETPSVVWEPEDIEKAQHARLRSMLAIDFFLSPSIFDTLVRLIPALRDSTHDTRPEDIRLSGLRTAASLVCHPAADMVSHLEDFRTRRHRELGRTPDSSRTRL